MNKQYRFQLISPVIGEKIYQTNSIKKGIKKCYEELKSVGIKDHKEFCVMDTVSYETYKFAINNKNNNELIDHKNKKIKKEKDHKNISNNENIINQKDNIAVENNNQISYEKKIDYLENNINILNNKIKTLEQQILTINNNRINKIENENNSDCKIM